jgi:hypothetical protein
VKLSSPRLRLLKFNAILLLLVFAGMGLFVVLRPSPPAVVVLPLPNGWPAPKPSVLARWRSVVPGWLWRLRDSLHRPRKVIRLDAAMIGFRDLPASGLAGLWLGAPQFADANGHQVWIVGESKLSRLRNRLERAPANEMVAFPRVDTANGIRAQMFSGGAVYVQGTQCNVGLAMDFLPRVRSDSIDLTTIIALTEAVTNRMVAPAGSPESNVVSIQTNLIVAARIQIPQGSGVFLLDESNRGMHGKRIGVIISATVPQLKK